MRNQVAESLNRPSRILINRESRAPPAPPRRSPYNKGTTGSCVCKRKQERAPTTRIPRPLPTSSSICTNQATEGAFQISRNRAANPHGKQVGPNDGGKLEDAIAQQIAGKRPGDQLINELPQAEIRRTEEEKGRPAFRTAESLSRAATIGSRSVSTPALVDRRSDNNTHPQRNRPNQNRQRDVLILGNFAPQMIWRHLVQDVEAENENHDAQERA